MPTRPDTRPPRLPQRPRRRLAGPAGARRDGRGSHRARSPRRFCALYTANGMSLPQKRARHRRVELVPDGREGRRVRVRQIDRAARPVPQAAQLPGRPAPSERPEGRPAHLLRHVADRRAAAQPEARHVQLGRPRSGRRAAHQAVLPAAVAGAVDRRRHRLPLAHRHDLVQPRRQADPGGEQPAARLRPPVSRRPGVAAGRAREAAAADQAGRRRRRKREVAQQATRQVRPREDGPVPDVARTKSSRG